MAGYPAWMIIAAAGTAVILIASVSLRLYCHFTGAYRGTFGLCGLLAGGIAVCAAQIALTIHARRADSRVRLHDAVISPFIVWQSAANRPEECRSWIQTFVWALTLVFCSVAVIGGIRYDRFDDLFAVEETDRGPGPIDRALGVGDEDEDDADSTVNTRPEMNTEIVEEIPQYDCALYGVMPDGASDAGRLMVARMYHGKWTHAATINGDDLPPDDARAILRAVPQLLTKEPLVETRLRAIWLKPKILLRLQTARCRDDGELTEPEFIEVVWAKTDDTSDGEKAAP